MVVVALFQTTVLVSLGETKFFCSGRVGAGISPAFQSDGVIVEGLKDGAAGTVSTDMFAANGANREFYNTPLRMGETNFVCWSNSNHAGGYVRKLYPLVTQPSPYQQK